MGAPRKLPDKATLERLWKIEKLRLVDIADRYGVTPSGVWKALEREGLTNGCPTFHDVIPWSIEARHRNMQVTDYFRIYSSDFYGKAVAPHRLAKLEAWFLFLQSNQLVVDYHPEQQPNPASRKHGGWHYVPRTPDDKWIVRMPCQS